MPRPQAQPPRTAPSACSVPVACSSTSFSGAAAARLERAEQARAPRAFAASVSRACDCRQTRGADRGADEIDRQQDRERVDRILGYLAQHADDQHFVADSKQAGRRQQHLKATCIRLRSARRLRRRAVEQLERQRGAEKVQRDASSRGSHQAKLRYEPERGTEHAEHRAESVARHRARGDRLRTRVPSPAASRPSMQSRAAAAGTFRRTQPTNAMRRMAAGQSDSTAIPIRDRTAARAPGSTRR